MTQLVDLLCGPLVKLVEISIDEEIRQAFDITDDITEVSCICKLYVACYHFVLLSGICTLHWNLVMIHI